MGWFLLALVILLAGAVAVQLAARSQRQIRTSASPQKALSLFEACFIERANHIERRAGQVSVRPRMKRNAPTLTAKAEARSGVTIVSVWMSEWAQSYLRLRPIGLRIPTGRDHALWALRKTWKYTRKLPGTSLATE